LRRQRVVDDMDKVGMEISCVPLKRRQEEFGIDNAVSQSKMLHGLSSSILMDRIICSQTHKRPGATRSWETTMGN